ncbi:MAG TPA: DUF4177 domain-containing protein [Paracoccus sp. (in: a-proteobacteria)]|uniref:DUF4177 domain-containing protein n=1 Tax=Paracoccus sp. TaxID=267 RepID=UPI002CA894B4|nr:DUF4177 domain-containing protein [Paracoccus sp. (in: a-proteobacteria)]HWL57524.1 DUF4177 domain-containing protein [Paracoccus sp. (in: a-proteobacteria)]
MSSYEYTVIPAPGRAEKSKGAKAGIERFAATLGDVLNTMARDGWEYVRAEVLPAEERSGLTSRTTIYHNLLIFRRPTGPVPLREPTPAAANAAPEAPPAAPAPVTAPAPEPAMQERPAQVVVDLPADAPVRAPFSQPMRSNARPTPARVTEPPLSAPEISAPAGPRLGPASR